MARYRDAEGIYVVADEWRRTCLCEGKSLLWKDEAVWTEENLRQFKEYFTDKPDESQRRFEEKFREQLAPASPDVTKLACELVLIYFLFPVPSSVSGNRKRELICEVASWRNIRIDENASAVEMLGQRNRWHRPRLQHPPSI